MSLRSVITRETLFFVEFFVPGRHLVVHLLVDTSLKQGPVVELAALLIVFCCHT